MFFSLLCFCVSRGGGEPLADSQNDFLRQFVHEALTVKSMRMPLAMDQVRLLDLSDSQKRIQWVDLKNLLSNLRDEVTFQLDSEQFEVLPLGGDEQLNLTEEQIEGMSSTAIKSKLQSESPVTGNDLANLRPKPRDLVELQFKPKQLARLIDQEKLPGHEIKTLPISDLQLKVFVDEKKVALSVSDQEVLDIDDLGNLFLQVNVEQFLKIDKWDGEVSHTYVQSSVAELADLYQALQKKPLTEIPPLAAVVVREHQLDILRMIEFSIQTLSYANPQLRFGFEFDGLEDSQRQVSWSYLKTWPEFLKSLELDAEQFEALNLTGDEPLKLERDQITKVNKIQDLNKESHEITGGDLATLSLSGQDMVNLKLTSEQLLHFTQRSDGDKPVMLTNPQLENLIKAKLISFKVSNDQPELSFNPVFLVSVEKFLQFKLTDEQKHDLETKFVDLEWYNSARKRLAASVDLVEALTAPASREEPATATAPASTEEPATATAPASTEVSANLTESTSATASATEESATTTAPASTLESLTTAASTTTTSKPFVTSGSFSRCLFGSFILALKFGV